MSSDEEIGFDPTRTGDPLIGKTLGEYVVRARLGEGAMGVVYRGEQPMLGKPVAVKLLRAEYTDTPKLAQKFVDEARALTAARHPNIIEIYAFGQTPGGQQYMVMELLDGEPLDVYLRNEGGTLAIEEALALLKQVASGLQAAHAAGVIHRDLKPANLFLVRLADGNRFIKILDFGAAKRAATPSGAVRPTAGVLVGTPLYMAPEQVAVTDITPATDLYALGCIAYELVVGKPPFYSESVFAVLEQHQSGELQRVTLPGVPDAYFDLVHDLLKKDMRQRPQSAAEVKKRLEALERAVLPAPTQMVQRPTRIQPAPPIRDTAPAIPQTQPSVPAQRRAWPWLVLAGLALPIVLLAGIVIGETEKPQPAAPVPQPAPIPHVVEAVPAVLPEPPPSPEHPPTPPLPPQPHAVAPRQAEALRCRSAAASALAHWSSLKNDPKNLLSSEARRVEELKFATAPGPECRAIVEAFEKRIKEARAQ